MALAVIGLVALLAVQAAVADPAEKACYDRETTQQGMTGCAGAAYQRADRALNRQWTILVNATRDRALRAEQLKGQRAWIAYRDSHCAAAAWASRGGSIWPMLVASCKAELTRNRTRELAAMAAPR